MFPTRHCGWSVSRLCTSWLNATISLAVMLFCAVVRCVVVQQQVYVLCQDCQIAHW